VATLAPVSTGNTVVRLTLTAADIGTPTSAALTGLVSRLKTFETAVKGLAANSGRTASLDSNGVTGAEFDYTAGTVKATGVTVTINGKMYPANLQS